MVMSQVTQISSKLLHPTSEFKKIRRENSRAERCWLAFNTLVLTLIALLMLYPLVNTLALSFSNSVAVSQGQVGLLPIGFTISSWRMILRDTMLWRSMLNSIYISVFGTFASLLFTAIFAYPLANQKFRLRRIVMLMVVLTMIFRYPIIPYFLTIRSLGLIDKLNVLIYAHLLIPYNLVIMRTFFQGIPVEMEEAALVEGANPVQILFKVILPISKPVLATLGLFYAVTYWNLFLHPLLFIRSPQLYTMQIRLRQFIDFAQSEIIHSELIADLSSRSIEAATIMFATVPIMILYPFLQRYFVKGTMIGSLKG
jgi:putative aldouronate transport system permease protein